LDIHPLKN